MAESLNPEASHHLPAFITAPGSTDVLMVIMAAVLAVSILAFGILFLRLHTLPERMAHKSQKIQFEIVAVLGLLALFTHMHIFWVAGLLLALIDFPDFGSFMGRIAGSVERIADVKAPEATGEVQSPELARSGLAPETHDRGGRGDGTTTSPTRPETVPARKKEASHA